MGPQSPDQPTPPKQATEPTPFPAFTGPTPGMGDATRLPVQRPGGLRESVGNLFGKLRGGSEPQTPESVPPAPAQNSTVETGTMPSQSNPLQNGGVEVHLPGEFTPMSDPEFAAHLAAGNNPSVDADHGFGSVPAPTPLNHESTTPQAPNPNFGFPPGYADTSNRGIPATPPSSPEPGTPTPELSPQPSYPLPTETPMPTVTPEPTPSIRPMPTPTPEVSPKPTETPTPSAQPTIPVETPTPSQPTPYPEVTTKPTESPKPCV